MDLKELDAILGSAEKGPVTETFSKKGNIVYASYKSALESGRVKAILEAKPNLVRTIHTKDIFYPAIALNINVSDLPTLHKELVLRNDFIGSSLKKIIPIFKSKVNPEVGHVKLLFDSAPTRNRIIERQNVSAFGRKFHADLTGTGRFDAASTANNTVMSPKCAPLQPQGADGALQITTPDPALVKTHLLAATAKENIAPVTHTVPNKLRQ